MKQILERLSILHKSILKEGIRLNVQTFAINLESLIDDMMVELAKEQEIEKRKNNSGLGCTRVFSWQCNGDDYINCTMRRWNALAKG